MSTPLAAETYNQQPSALLAQQVKPFYPWLFQCTERHTVPPPARCVPPRSLRSARTQGRSSTVPRAPDAGPPCVQANARTRISTQTVSAQSGARLYLSQEAQLGKASSS